MTMPHTPIELMRLRLHPSAVQRSAVLAEVFDPIGAATVGYVDHIVEPDRVMDDARAAARSFLDLDASAHARTKRRVRGPAVDAIRTAIERDRTELTSLLG
jgi:enoyl-CoA hydratase